MHVFHGIAQRRIWLLALAAIAAVLAAAALSAPARADNEDDFPAGTDSLLDRGINISLKLKDNPGNVVQPGAHEVELELSYTGETQTPVVLYPGSYLRARVEWLRNSNNNPRLEFAAYTIPRNDSNHCKTKDVGDRNGDPSSDDYGQDVDPDDDVVICKVSLFAEIPGHSSNAADQAGMFRVHQGDSSFTISAVVRVGAGPRTHEDHKGSSPSLFQQHYPRAVITLRDTLEVAVGQPPEIKAAALAVGAACGEADADRGALGTGSQTAPCRTTLQNEGDSTSLVLSILDERGNPAAAGSISSAIVSATLGALSTSDSLAPNNSCSGLICRLDSSALNGGNTGAIPITITHSGIDNPGAAVVSASVIDAKGNVFTTDQVEIILAGQPAGISISEPAAALADRATPEDDNTDKLQLTVSGVDKGGRSAPLIYRSPRAVIKDPNGKTVSAGIEADWAGGGSAFPVNRSGAPVVNLTVTADPAVGDEPLAAGEYTLELRTAGLTASQKFTVAGRPATLVITEPQGSLAVGGTFTVTAAVRGADGGNVPDGTPISWSANSASGAGSYVALRDAQTVIKSGEASASYLVLALGRIVLTASAGGLSEAKLITVGAPLAVENLSGRTAGFQSYLGGSPAAAAELLAELPAISGILLYQDGEWIRYSIAAGRAVPGSVNFTVKLGSVLWLTPA